MAKILAMVLSDGLPAVESACAKALIEGVSSADVIINILSRQRDPAPPITIMTPDALMRRGTERVGWSFTFVAAAYNLVRLPKLLMVAT